MPADVARVTADAKAIYLNAIRDWVRLRQASEYAFDGSEPRRARPRPTEDVAQAHVLFKLGST